VYQGRFKSFPVQTDEHFITVVRYVERNALRAKLVERAEEWRWCSIYRFSRRNAKLTDFLSSWPMERPQNWIELVNEPDKTSELDDLRASAQRGRPFGSEDWMINIAKQLGLEATMHRRGRPRRT
jgi:putative transposase